MLAYRLLKGTGRRVGEVASLHLECLDIDEHGKDVLVYDNHKAGRMGRRLPLADSALVEAIRAQQAWVRGRFPDTPAEQLWLLPEAAQERRRHHPPRRPPDQHLDASLGGAHPPHRRGRPRRPRRAGPLRPVAIHPHAFRHTYAQTLADQGVPAAGAARPDGPPQHRHHARLLPGRRGQEACGHGAARPPHRRQPRHRPARSRASARASPQLREQLSWVAVPMGKCSEPTNVRAGGQACPIRYQCAGCPHFESDPSYLPELRAYADELRARTRGDARRRGRRLGGRPTSTRQLEVIVGHIRTHEALLERLPAAERAPIEDASATLRKARQSVPVAFGRRRMSHG